MHQKQEDTNVVATVSALADNEMSLVSGGQAQKAYCVYGNGSVGVHDYGTMTSRPLNSGELCSR